MATPRPQPHSAVFEQLRARFVDRPLSVSFRDIVGPLPADASAHRIHPYPARLLRQVPVFVFGCNQLTEVGQTVYDPFCGSGTVLVEAMAHGYASWGTDPNPFAALLSRVKVTPVDPLQIQDSSRLILRSASARDRVVPSHNRFMDRWFSASSRIALEGLRAAIEQHSLPHQRDVFLLTLSLTAERIAHKDGRIPVPVRLQGDPPHLLPQAIRKRYATNLQFILDRLPRPVHVNDQPRVFEGQASSCLSIIGAGRARRPHLILTSPPYGAAQKYIRTNSISLATIGMASESDFSKLNSLLAGREWLKAATRGAPLPDGLQSVPGVVELIEKIFSLNPMRAAIYGQYFTDMWHSFVANVSALQPGGHYVLVSSSNTVAGLQIETHEILAAMLQALGLRRVLSLEDRIAGRSLMTRRARTAYNPIQSEVVHFFSKESDD